jgi:hypothetical protein
VNILQPSRKEVSGLYHTAFLQLEYLSLLRVRSIELKLHTILHTGFTKHQSRTQRSASCSHNFSSSDCSISKIDPLIIITMKLVIYFVIVASMNAIDYASAAGLRLTSSQESDAAIATNDLLSSDNNDGRELLSAWCDPATPALWHP